MGVADAPAAARDAALALARGDYESGKRSEPDCSPTSLALVLHRGGGVAAMADALAAAPGGAAAAGCGVEPEALATLHSAVPGLECAPPRPGAARRRALTRHACVALRRKASPAAMLSALAAMLQRCSSSQAAPARGVAASGLAHALSLLSAGGEAGGGAGGLPQGLLRLISPSASMFAASLRPLGKGGFGTVFAAVGAVDGRAVALKRVPFRSPLPPWAAGGALAAAHAPLLREAKALAALSHAHVARYHAAWVEPRWDRLAAALTEHVGGGAPSSSDDDRAAAAETAAAARGLRRRSTLRIRDAAATSSEEEAARSSDDDDDDDDASESSAAWSASDASGWSSRTGASRLALPPLADAEGLSGDSSAGGDASSSASSLASSSSLLSQSAEGALALALRAPPAPRPMTWPYCLYISMELVPGPTLQRWLLARADDARCWAADVSGALAPPAAAQARALGAQLAHGLAHMHGRGVLHRDLKPANVVLAPGRSRGRAGDDVAPLRAVIVDLGLAAFAPGGVVADAEGGAAAADPSPSPDDGHTGGVGTATYAAPEQASGRGYGPPADVYSLGLILLELLCRFGTGMERARAMAAARAGALPREALERSAPGAAALVAAMLSPDPALRPTAAAVARSPALRRAGGDQAGGDVAALRAALAAKEAELGRLRAALERATVAAA